MVLGMVYGIGFLAHYNTLHEFLLSDDIIGDWCIASPSPSSRVQVWNKTDLLTEKEVPVTCCQTLPGSLRVCQFAMESHHF